MRINWDTVMGIATKKTIIGNLESWGTHHLTTILEALLGTFFFGFPIDNGD